MDKKKIFTLVKSIAQDKTKLSMVIIIIFTFGVIMSNLNLFSSTSQQHKKFASNEKSVAELNPTTSVKNADITLISANNKYVQKEIQKEHKKAIDTNQTYIQKEYDTKHKTYGQSIYKNKHINIIKTTTIKKENNQTQVVKTEKNTTKKPIITIKQGFENPFDGDTYDQKTTNENNKPSQINIRAAQTMLNVLPDGLKIQTNPNGLKQKEAYYSSIAGFSDAYKNDGGFKIISLDSEKISNNSNYNMNNQQKQNSINNFKIKAGSKYYALLEIPINSIYAGEIKPIAKIISGDLVGDVLIGEAMPTTNNISLILKFNRLILSNGDEKGVNGVGININNINPTFVDDLDRHLFPRIVFATLGDMINNYNSQQSGGISATTTQPNGTITTAPAQSILGSLMGEIANSYKNEIKINKQVFIVIFY